MLLYEQLDAFVIRPENTPEPVECFIKRHFPRPADQIICVRNDFFLHRNRQVVPFRQSEPFCLPRCNSCTNMTFNYIDEGMGETQFPANFYASDGVMDVMRSRSADIMEQPTLPDQFAINLNLHASRERISQFRYDKTVSNDIAWTSGSNKYFYICIMHWM